MNERPMIINEWNTLLKKWQNARKRSFSRHSPRFFFAVQCLPFISHQVYIELKPPFHSIVDIFILTIDIINNIIRSWQLRPPGHFLLSTNARHPIVFIIINSIPHPRHRRQRMQPQQQPRRQQQQIIQLWDRHRRGETLSLIFPAFLVRIKIMKTKSSASNYSNRIFLQTWHNEQNTLQTVLENRFRHSKTRKSRKWTCVMDLRTVGRTK